MALLEDRRWNMSNVIISPIFYMGNKKKLIKKNLINLFPDNINKMIDLFSGSAIVSMNTKANQYFINDTDEHLIELYNLFKNIEHNHQGVRLIGVTLSNLVNKEVTNISLFEYIKSIETKNE